MTTTGVYTTRTDAIDYDIEPALGEYAACFDMDAIFDEYFTYDEDMRGFVRRDDVDFWDIVKKHDLTDPENYDWSPIDARYDYESDYCVADELYEIELKGLFITARVTRWASGESDVFTTSDWQGPQPQTLDEADDYTWIPIEEAMDV